MVAIRMMSILLTSIALFVLAPAVAFAQAMQPLPNPDLSKLKPAESAEVREARAAFDKAIVGKSGVQLAEMYGDIGAVYARVRQYAVAAVAVDNAARAAPLDGRWAYLQGVLARARADNSQARAAFERALRLNGMYLPARMALAAELINANDLDGAGKLLTVALADNESEPALRAVLGDIAFRQKRYPEAIAYFNEALRLDPQANLLYAALARAHEAGGNAQAARDAQAKAGDVPPRLDDPLMQKLMPVFDASATTTAAASASEPPRDPKQLAIGEANFHAVAGRFDAARAALDKALAQHPRDAALLANYARVEASDGRVEAARTRARAAVAADPKSALAWTTQGLVLEMGNDDVGARDAYRRAVALEAKAPRAQVALGNIALRSGKADEAVSAYRAAAAATPEDAGAWARLLAAEFVAGQCAAGVREAADNVRKHPRDPLFAELNIRAVSTCPAATPAQKQAVLADAQKLYEGTKTNLAQAAEAYALALAANGKWQDAAQTQGAAVYEAVRAGDQAAVAQYREFFQVLQNQKMPQRPWPDAHPLFKPQRPAPVPKASSAPAPAK